MLSIIFPIKVVATWCIPYFQKKENTDLTVPAVECLCIYIYIHTLYVCIYICIYKCIYNYIYIMVYFYTVLLSIRIRSATTENLLSLYPTTWRILVLIVVRLVITLRISWGDVPSGWESIPGCGDYDSRVPHVTIETSHHSDSTAPHDLVTPQ